MVDECHVTVPYPNIVEVTLEDDVLEEEITETRVVPLLYLWHWKTGEPIPKMMLITHSMQSRKTWGEYLTLISKSDHGGRSMALKLATMWNLKKSWTNLVFLEHKPSNWYRHCQVLLMKVSKYKMYSVSFKCTPVHKADHVGQLPVYLNLNATMWICCGYLLDRWPTLAIRACRDEFIKGAWANASILIPWCWLNIRVSIACKDLRFWVEPWAIGIRSSKIWATHGQRVDMLRVSAKRGNKDQVEDHYSGSPKTK